MKINKKILYSILSELADIYPGYSSEEHYHKIQRVIDNDNLFLGHLLYLSEKSLITTDLSWNSAIGEYQLDPGKLKINCYGIDYLAAPLVL